LSKEIKALSEQLPRLLEKEKEKSKANKQPASAHEGYNPGILSFSFFKNAEKL